MGVAVALGALCLVSLLVGIARALCIHIRTYDRQAAAAAMAATAAAAKQAALLNLQRVTPVIILQPGYEVCTGYSHVPMPALMSVIVRTALNSIG